MVIFNSYVCLQNKTSSLHRIPLHGGFPIENTKNPHGRYMVKKQTSINNGKLQIANQQSFIIDQLYPLLSPYV